MSETILRVPVADLAAARVRCGACRVSFEVGLDLPSVNALFRDGYCCPLCKSPFGTLPPTGNPLRDLALALSRLRNDAGAGAVDFAVPPPS